jgi:D-alanine-D-alanine ligase
MNEIKPQKRNIAIVAGGDSGEFEISVKSAAVVKRYLNAELFRSFIILIKGTSWTWEDEKGLRIEIDKRDFSLSLPEELIHFDVVFNAIHGTPGEDGKLLGYFDLLKIPYTSSGMATSSLTFNKFLCNNFVRSFGIPVSASKVIQKGKVPPVDEIVDTLGLPVFVKPNRGGSSVGTTKVSRRDDLLKAIELALKEDEQVMVEAFIPGREITCGVITFKGGVKALPITEIVSKKEFFDYEAKYLGMSDEITPANIPEDIARKCRDTSVFLYNLLNCRGIARIDYIFNDKGMFFLEVNTVPGLSEASIVPQQARADGISLEEMFTEAILTASNS